MLGGKEITGEEQGKLEKKLTRRQSTDRILELLERETEERLKAQVLTLITDRGYELLKRYPAWAVWKSETSAGPSRTVTRYAIHQKGDTVVYEAKFEVRG